MSNPNSLNKNKQVTHPTHSQQISIYSTFIWFPNKSTMHLNILINNTSRYQLPVRRYITINIKRIIHKQIVYHSEKPKSRWVVLLTRSERWGAVESAHYLAHYHPLPFYYHLLPFVGSQKFYIKFFFLAGRNFRNSFVWFGIGTFLWRHRSVIVWWPLTLFCMDHIQINVCV